jgi:hypothetical protein
MQARYCVAGTGRCQQAKPSVGGISRIRPATQGSTRPARLPRRGTWFAHEMAANYPALSALCNCRYASALAGCQGELPDTDVATSCFLTGSTSCPSSTNSPPMASRRACACPGLEGTLRGGAAEYHHPSET